MTPPGLRLRRLAARVCDERTMAIIVDPAVADLQHEAEQARGAGGPHVRPPLARYAAVWKVIGYAIGRSLIHSAAAGVASERTLLRHTVTIALGIALVLTMLLTVPPLLTAPAPNPLAHRSLLFVYLLPQAVSLGIPIGVSGAVAFALRSRPLTLGVAAPLAGLALFASILTLAVVQWLLPAANQAFRDVATGSHLEPGLGELALTELARRSDPASVLTLHARLSVAAATFTLAVPGAVIMRLFRRTWAALTAGLLAFLAFYLCLGTAVHVGHRAPILVAWGPSLLPAAIAIALAKLRPIPAVHRRP